MTNESEDLPQTDLALYGHPMSSYTWKVLIALYAEGTPFDYRLVDKDHPEHVEAVQSAGPMGKIPVLADKENMLFEATSIIEYLSKHYGGNEMIVPTDPDAAIGMRMLDRVFDNYVMGPVTHVVHETLRDAPDAARIEAEKEKLGRSYAWLEGWLQFYPPMDHITLIECAAGPALYFSGLVRPVDEAHPRLARWRQHLMRLPPIAQCIADSRPYRDVFPLDIPKDE